MGPDESWKMKLNEAGISSALKSKWESLLDDLASLESCVIAYSGGVDSSFLVFAASQIPALKKIAVTILTPLDPPDGVREAVVFAGQHGIPHETIPIDPLQNKAIRSNPVDRCFHCKLDMLNILWEYARRFQYQSVIEGQNADDLSEYRPGRKAVEETGTLSPLARLGFTKSEIRILARAFSLSIWDKPASPCLATRFPYGTTITRDALHRIGLAESFLHDQGFHIARVRYHQDLARIEVELEQFRALMELRENILRYFKQIGFLHVSLDLQGYRLGSMDEGIIQ